jgi:hypothetical protein
MLFRNRSGDAIADGGSRIVEKYLSISFLKIDGILSQAIKENRIDLSFAINHHQLQIRPFRKQAN